MIDEVHESVLKTYLQTQTSSPIPSPVITSAPIYQFQLPTCYEPKLPCTTCQYKDRCKNAVIV